MEIKRGYVYKCEDCENRVYADTREVFDLLCEATNRRCKDCYTPQSPTDTEMLDWLERGAFHSNCIDGQFVLFTVQGEKVGFGPTLLREAIADAMKGAE
jgi:hypothetical protein